MKRLMFALFFVLSLINVLPAQAAPIDPRLGWEVLPRSALGQYSPEQQVDLATSGLKTIKFLIPNGFGTDPNDVERAIYDGVKTVILSTGSIQYGEVRSQVETPGSFGYSYGDLIQKHPDIRFWLEIGNEPDVGGVDAWWYRSEVIETYKRLALNIRGDVDQGWRWKFPNLKWAVNMPTSFDQTMTVLRWDYNQDYLRNGGIRTYFDAVSIHIYGWTQFSDGAGKDFLRIYQYLLSDPDTRAILVTEFGIDDSSQSYLQKAIAYRTWANAQPDKVVAMTAFLFCADGWTHYSVGCDPSAAVAYRG